MVVAIVRFRESIVVLSIQIAYCVAMTIVCLTCRLEPENKVC